MSFRSKELHVEHCQTMQSNPTLPYVMGVKKYCPLNSLQYFHTTANFSVDIMHDILEGVAQYEMKLLIQHLIRNDTTSAEVQRRIQSFNYGFMKQNNKPPGVKLVEGSNDFGLNAIQSWCLLRHLPIMFGDLVHPNDQHWYLFILLLQMVSIVFSSVVSSGITIYQKILIKDEQVLFITTALETICLNEHVHAYKVLRTSEAPFVLDIKGIFLPQNILYTDVLWR